MLQLNRDVIFFVFQVSSGHTDVSAVQQGLDQGEDLRAASSSGPAGVQVKASEEHGAVLTIVFLTCTCV